MGPAETALVAILYAVIQFIENHLLIPLLPAPLISLLSV